MIPESSWWPKIAVLLLIFLGEAFAIFAEMSAAQAHDAKLPITSIAYKSFILIVIAGALLISGYMFGFQSFKNIWIVSVTSITSILIIEPILAYSFFSQLPTKGAIIGLILGALGFTATLVIK